jgi:hypothetical protein
MVIYGWLRIGDVTFFSFFLQFIYGTKKSISLISFRKKKKKKILILGGLGTGKERENTRWALGRSLAQGAKVMEERVKGYDNLSELNLTRIS